MRARIPLSIWWIPMDLNKRNSVLWCIMIILTHYVKLWGYVWQVLRNQNTYSWVCVYLESVLQEWWCYIFSLQCLFHVFLRARETCAEEKFLVCCELRVSRGVHSKGFSIWVWVSSSIMAEVPSVASCYTVLIGECYRRFVGSQFYHLQDYTKDNMP